MAMDMRGLSIFISDIRKAATSKEAEQARIDKELAKIRQKFSTAAKLSGYDRKKYICKLLYMYMLGYDIDFGHMEAINLLSSDKYSEKHVGYLAITLLLNENHQLITLITNSIKSDLLSNREFFQSLALTAICNIGGKDFAEAMASDVQKILLNPQTKQVTRKKAALALLRLYTKYSEFLSIELEPVVELLSSVDLGVVNCVASLVLGLLARNERARNEWSSCVAKVIRVLSKIVISKDYTQDYVYYGVPAPWLQVKLFQILQYFPMPTDGALKNQVVSVLNKIITASERFRTVDKSRTPSRNNAVNSVLIEAINLCIHYDKDRDLINMSANILGRFLTDTKDTNLRYVGLATMTRLAFCGEGDAMKHIRKHQQTIVVALKDADISIRRRALDLLYCMCDKNNAGEIVGELMDYLTTADFNIREDLVLKIAILSEKFAVDYTWYVDVVVNIITQAGDFVSDDVYYRVIQIITNNEDIQKHAADTVFRMLATGTPHEVAVSVASYILGEFGYLIAEDSESGPLQQFNTLHQKFHLMTDKTKANLLNTYAKFYNMFDNQQLRDRIKRVFEENKSHMNEEIQQRSTEYLALITNVSEDTMGTVLENMPQYNLKAPAVLQAQQPLRGSAGATGAQEGGEGEEGGAETAEAPAGIHTPAPAALAAPAAPTPAPSVGLDFDDFTTPTPAKPAAQPAATPAPAPKAAAADFLDDFLGGPTPAAPAKPAAPISSASPFDDIFGGPAPAAPAGAPAAGGGDFFFGGAKTEKKMTDAQKAEVRANFLKILASNDGTLYEDENLQVTVKVEVHGYQGRSTVQWINKTATQLSNLNVNLLDVPSPGLKISITSCDSKIPPSGRVQQLLNVECNDAFSGNARLEAQYESAQALVKLDLPVPLTVARFIEPMRVADKDAFFTVWRSTRSVTEPPASAVFRTGDAINLDTNERALVNGLHFTVLRAVDGNASNMVGCGNFMCKAKGSVPVLINVEANTGAGAIRLTLKTPEGQVQDGLTPLVKQFLGEKQA